MDIWLQLLVNGAILLTIQYFSCGSTGKESACNEGDLGSIPGVGGSPGEGKTTHSSILLAWRIPWTTVHGF